MHEPLSHSQWFQRQLTTSAEGLLWSIEQVPVGRRYAQPPPALGEWSAARHLFHIVYYERTWALPSMRQWLDGPRPDTAGLSEDQTWEAEVRDLDKVKAELREVRAFQVGLLSHIPDSAWDKTREAIWGPVTLLWVVSKTYQHTAEHISDILRIALFWDMAG